MGRESIKFGSELNISLKMLSSEQKLQMPVSDIIFWCLLKEKSKINVVLTAVVLVSRQKKCRKKFLVIFFG